MNKTVKLLLYCTKAKPYLARNVFNSNDKGYGLYSFKPIQYGKYIGLNGKIVAEAECNLVEKEEYSYACDDYATFDDDRLEATCLSRNQLNEYGKYRSLYLTNLKNVKPLDEPKELSEYYNKKPLSYNDWLYGIYSGGKGAKGNYESYLNVFKLKKAPQNMMYCYDKDGNLYVLISVQSLHMCNIMNYDKTIEVRKSILNLLRELVK